ncbi:aminoglycoside phosphotransferase [Paenibacillus curdlanolyticus YK9]|uniref:Aminoglycoside phosphotransferase n=1 Tax=Paenibacillus curdlanolyticus YK9 TaxID=717606 RepID=E0IGF4_9BACL|nr:phosphotransferase [Paenibacillus curdlanolyticus]EFM08454.1 aminoglycoside phosphotransferase [Paenibacillus curdlanolyticus YK9]
MTKWDELLKRYFEGVPGYVVEPVPFGLTNDTKVVTVDGRKCIARMYNAHLKNVPAMRLEAEITSELASMGLSFQVPQFQETLDAKLFVQLSDGTLGAVTTFLEGTVYELAGAEQAYGLGRVIGELSSALSGTAADSFAYRGRPFTDFYGLHPLANKSAVHAFLKEPPFAIADEDRSFYMEMLTFVERESGVLEQLPKQFVHHDVLIFNLLAIDNRIHAVLDFDLMSWDIAFLEFAIGLNHVLQMSNGSRSMAEAFVQGYSEYRTATRQEIAQLSLLTRLYHLAVLHIYVGQHYAGHQVEPYFTFIMQQFRTRMDWLTEHKSSIEELLLKSLLGEE